LNTLDKYKDFFDRGINAEEKKLYNLGYRTPFEIEESFQKICQEVENLGEGPGIAALTRDPRDTWAENREYLMKLGEEKVYLLTNNNVS